jgi:hypothetical protein
MSQAGRFYVNGFLLRVFDSAYLVEVKPANGETGYYQKPSSLPDWMFRSSHAIWLSEEDAPMVDRARKGDAIKKEIISRSGRTL